MRMEAMKDQARPRGRTSQALQRQAWTKKRRRRRCRNRRGTRGRKNGQAHGHSHKRPGYGPVKEAKKRPPRKRRD